MTNEDVASALGRWEEEGGAQVPPWALKYEGGNLADTERHVLECLGAALVSHWNELSRDVQRTIFQRAATNTAYDPTQLKAHIARFLHDHKDAAGGR
jgi:hypothetical protein